jgi:hypothetical protein
MSGNLHKRVARLEIACQTEHDWRQFGDDPRDMPDWALVASLLWHYDQDPELRCNPQIIEIRRLYDAGETDAAFDALGSIVQRS